MNLEEFFELHPGEQEKIITAWRHRKDIQSARHRLDLRQAELTEDFANLKEDCKHLAVSIKYCCNEDDYGKMMDSGYREYKCPDCGKNWTEDA